MIILNKNYITHEYLYPFLLCFLQDISCDIKKIVQYLDQINQKT